MRTWALLSRLPRAAFRGLLGLDREVDRLPLVRWPLDRQVVRVAWLGLRVVTGLIVGDLHGLAVLDDAVEERHVQRAAAHVLDLGHARSRTLVRWRTLTVCWQTGWALRVTSGAAGRP